MYQEHLKNSEAYSFSDYGFLWPMTHELARTTDPLRKGRAMASEFYILGCEDIVHRFDYVEDLFYFYPDDIQGFITSCILATQRLDDVVNRDMQIFYDVNAAMQSWLRLEESSMAYQYSDPGTRMSKETILSHVHRAVKFGAVIDDMVRLKMQLIRDIHGDYAVDEKSITWTRLNAVRMKIHFA